MANPHLPTRAWFPAGIDGTFHRIWIVVVVLLGVVIGDGTCSLDAAPATRNVFLITTDGLRRQEVFTGAEEFLISTQPGGVKDTNALRRAFWRPTPIERRNALLPFFWSELVAKGQLFGDESQGSLVRVSNGLNFSYPGYSELLVGYPDPAIDSNDKKPNVNVTVLEWLHAKPAFRGKVAAFGCWDVFPSIINSGRCGFPVQAGWDIVDLPNPGREPLNRVLRQSPRVWDSVVYDSVMFDAAMEHIRAQRPRLVYLAFGETDDWAHDGRYDQYLHSAHRFDAFLRQLWEFVQSTPEYRDTTSFVITTDHGRGSGPVAWKSHGKALAESAYIWAVVRGPDTPALGIRKEIPLLTQSQTAATVATLLGEDYRASVSKAAAPFPGVIGARNP